MEKSFNRSIRIGQELQKNICYYTIFNARSTHQKNDNSF